MEVRCPLSDTIPNMTKRLEEVLKKVETWPVEIQEELADAALEIAATLSGEYCATDEELAGIDHGLADAHERRFATDEGVEAGFSKFRSR